jgi:hypothetical protein
MEMPRNLSSKVHDAVYGSGFNYSTTESSGTSGCEISKYLKRNEAVSPGCNHNSHYPGVQFELEHWFYPGDGGHESFSLHLRAECDLERWVSLSFYSLTGNELANGLADMETRLIMAWRSVNGLGS